MALRLAFRSSRRITASVRNEVDRRDDFVLGVLADGFFDMAHCELIYFAECKRFLATCTCWRESAYARDMPKQPKVVMLRVPERKRIATDPESQRTIIIADGMRLALDTTVRVTELPPASPKPTAMPVTAAKTR